MTVAESRLVVEADEDLQTTFASVEARLAGLPQAKAPSTQDKRMPSPPRSLVALSDAPLFLHPPAALALAERVRSALDRPRADWSASTEESGEAKPYALDNGIVTIPVRGALANRREDAWWGETSYEAFRGTLDAAMADPECKAVLLDIDSPGGDAAGAMETSAFIRQASTRKPVVAFVDGMACSAAYALACGAQDIVAAPSATLGSIGVVMLHWDMSKFLEDFGLKPTLLHSGAFKTDGWPTKPLEKAAAERLQRTLDVHYAHFTGTVGSNRPALGERGARKTEAGVFVGKDALAAGLADALGDRHAARAVALARISDTSAAAGDGPRLAGRSGAVFLSVRSAKMSVHLYGPGRAHADHLIDQGKVDKDADWSFSAEDGDKLLGDDGDDWDNYASFHLGEDDSEIEKTKARFKYPFGKDGKVFRSALVAIRQRAAAQKADDVEEAAGRLLEKIDGKTEEEARVADEKTLAAAREESKTAERARIGAILNSDAAKGRAEAALVMALDTDMSAEAAVKALGKMPAAAPGGTRLDREAPRIALGGDPGSEAEGSSIERGAAAMAAALGKKL